MGRTTILSYASFRRKWTINLHSFWNTRALSFAIAAVRLVVLHCFSKDLVQEMHACLNMAELLSGSMRSLLRWWPPTTPQSIRTERHGMTWHGMEWDGYALAPRAECAHVDATNWMRSEQATMPVAWQPNESCHPHLRARPAHLLSCALARLLEARCCCCSFDSCLFFLLFLLVLYLYHFIIHFTFYVKFDRLVSFKKVIENKKMQNNS